MLPKCVTALGMADRRDSPTDLPVCTFRKSADVSATFGEYLDRMPQEDMEQECRHAYDCSGGEGPKMPNHNMTAGTNRRGEMCPTRIGIVYADHVVLPGEERFLAGLCDLASLHIRRLIERDVVRGDLHICLQVLLEVSAAVAVPEESHLQPLYGKLSPR